MHYLIYTYDKWLNLIVLGKVYIALKVSFHQNKIGKYCQNKSI